MCQGYKCNGCCFSKECQENKRFECIYDDEKEPFNDDADKENNK